jgi:hypothetical protein
MNIKSKLALAAVLVAAVASPSFAGDQNSAAQDVSSGRVFGLQGAAPAAYASARTYAHANWSTDMAINDRLALGHN